MTKNMDLFDLLAGGPKPPSATEIVRERLKNHSGPIADIDSDDWEAFLWSGDKCLGQFWASPAEVGWQCGYELTADDLYTAATTGYLDIEPDGYPNITATYQPWLYDDHNLSAA